MRGRDTQLPGRGSYRIITDKANLFHFDGKGYFNSLTPKLTSHNNTSGMGGIFFFPEGNVLRNNYKFLKFI